MRRRREEKREGRQGEIYWKKKIHVLFSREIHFSRNSACTVFSICKNMTPEESLGLRVHLGSK